MSETGGRASKSSATPKLMLCSAASSARATKSRRERGGLAAPQFGVRDFWFPNRVGERRPRNSLSRLASGACGATRTRGTEERRTRDREKAVVLYHRLFI